MDRIKLDRILAAHRDWLACTGGSRADLSRADLSRAYLSRAYLSGADLSRADLSRANLSGAYLSGANLSGANLSDADLGGAYLSWANLRWANLRWANLSGANLSGANLRWANLSGADLRGTILAPTISPWDWQVANGHGIRSVGDRTMGLGIRSLKSQSCGDTVYTPGYYAGPWFSTDHTTDCHPGLYVGGKDWDCGSETVYVAYWLDEMICFPNKARVPRFRALASKEEFESLTEIA